MLKFLCCIFSLVFSLCFSSDYKLSLLETESFTDAKWGVKAINDKGQVLGNYTEKNTNISKIYVLDAKSGLIFIESKGNSLYPITLNNAGQVLGAQNNKPFIWSKVLGIRPLDIFNSSYISALDLNDLGQIIGQYQLAGKINEYRPFLWDYGVVTDLGPGSEFAQLIEVLGYHVMTIKLVSINNRGEWVGNFSHGKLNKKTNKYVVVGSENFFWDGDLHILPVPNSSKEIPSIIKVNNCGVVLLSDVSEKTYLWDKESGFQIIENLYPFDFNDSNTIFGNMHQYDEFGNETSFTGGIWREGILNSLASLLGVEDIFNLASPYSDDYSIERIDYVDWLNPVIYINNKGQIPCMGWIWGDSYPCLLEPIIKQEGLNKDLNSFMDSYNKSNDYDKGSSLRYAIRHDLNDISAHLISYGPDSYTDKDKCLFLAAEKGNVEAINQMIENGWNTNIKIKHDNRNLLQYSARMGQPEVCQLFIDLGQNPNEKDKCGYSSLHLATELAINAQSVQEKKTL